MGLTERTRKLIEGKPETEKDFKALVSRALVEYAGIHSWKSTRGALAHYSCNHDEFISDMTLWEAQTGGPSAIREQYAE